MRDLIKHIIKEETSKSVRLFKKLYDIEGDGASYRGDNILYTLVTFFPKDYDNEMTPYNGSSVCTWEMDLPFGLTYKSMTFPHLMNIPLFDYIGDTDDIEEYLKDIHRKEAEKFLVNLKKGRS